MLDQLLIWPIRWVNYVQSGARVASDQAFQLKRFEVRLPFFVCGYRLKHWFECRPILAIKLRYNDFIIPVMFVSNSRDVMVIFISLAHVTPSLCRFFTTTQHAFVIGCQRVIITLLHIPCFINRYRWRVTLLTPGISLKNQSTTTLVFIDSSTIFTTIWWIIMTIHLFVLSMTCFRH